MDKTSVSGYESSFKQKGVNTLELCEGLWAQSAFPLNEVSAKLWNVLWQSELLLGRNGSSEPKEKGFISLLAFICCNILYEFVVSCHLPSRYRWEQVIAH